MPDTLRSCLQLSKVKCVLARWLVSVFPKLFSLSLSKSICSSMHESSVKRSSRHAAAGSYKSCVVSINRLQLVSVPCPLALTQPLSICLLCLGHDAAVRFLLRRGVRWQDPNVKGKTNQHLACGGPNGVYVVL